MTDGVSDATPQGRRDRLKTLLIERAVSFGEFTLASGRKSGYYLDARLVTLHPEGAYLVAKAILDLMARERIEADAIGGLTMGADPIAAAVAAVSHLEQRPLPAFIVRKEAKGHGARRQVEGWLAPGGSVVVVDDVVTTAASTLQAAGAVESLGCRVAAVVSLVDREEGGEQALRQYRYYPLFRVSELIEDSARRS